MLEDDLTDRLELAGLIHLIRGHRVLIDMDLAVLYGLPTKHLVQAVGRNTNRFPEDFMFRLSAEEFESLRSQFVTSNARRGGRRYHPYVFTEQGVAMLSSVLRSERAVKVNIEIMRAFVAMRRLLAQNVELAQKLAEIEKRYDEQFKVVFDAIRELISPPSPKLKPIGFRPNARD